MIPLRKFVDFSVLSCLIASSALASICMLALSAIPGHASELVLCKQSDSFPQRAGARNLFGPDGQLLTLAVVPEVVDSNGQCDSIALPVGPAELLWSGLVAADTARLAQSNGYLLQGRFGDGHRATVSDVVGLGSVAREGSEKIFPGEDILTASRNFVFGDEGRASWNSDMSLSCEPGDRPAGVQFIGGGNWPSGQAGRLFVEASGVGQFQILVADRARIEGEAPLGIGELSFATSGEPEIRLLDLPEPDTNWQALTILCPSSSARLSIRRVAVLPSNPNPGEMINHRSSWLWSPTLWLENEELIWRIAEEQDLQEIYISIPVVEAGVSNEARLDRFLAAAHARGIQVWPVIGDRRDVFRSNWAALQTRIEGYARFNGQREVGQQLQGVQLDIEPYLIEGFALDAGYWRERYLETVAFARATVGPFLKIDLVVPVWWGTHSEFGAEFLERLTPYQVSLTVMNYRTDPLQLLQGAEPFLSWGDRNNRKVSIGLEVGTITDEEQHLFRPASVAGELWQLDLGEHTVLALFSEETASLEGMAFARYLTRPYSGGNISYSGDVGRLNEMAHFLSSNFSGRPAFRGISLHGLDELYVPIPSD